MNKSLMLSKLILKNFKNIKIENHLPLNNLNILISPNCSGKSSLIALLKFMRNCLISNPDEGRLPSLLVIDEPETGLHPSWMKTLAERIKMASERTQIIIATHSPDLLDHFTDRYKDVLCFQYDGKKHFIPRRLPEEELKVRLDEEWELGDLYRIAVIPTVGGCPW